MSASMMSGQRAMYSAVLLGWVVVCRQQARHDGSYAELTCTAVPGYIAKNHDGTVHTSVI